MPKNIFGYAITARNESLSLCLNPATMKQKLQYYWNRWRAMAIKRKTFWHHNSAIIKHDIKNMLPYFVPGTAAQARARRRGVAGRRRASWAAGLPSQDTDGVHPSAQCILTTYPLTREGFLELIPGKRKWRAKYFRAASNKTANTELHSHKTSFFMCIHGYYLEHFKNR